MIDMAKKKGRFASTMARFCTVELKSHPMIDYILDQNEHLLIIQGIRASESRNRKKMQKQCTFFKYYFEPYNNKGRTFTYRKKDITKFISKYSADILRPVFNWSAQEVINYILDNGQQPNQLYRQGFLRVGCFPCFMARHHEILEILNRYPERFYELEKFEEEIHSSFFKIDYIPKIFRTGYDKKSGKSFTKACDVRKYLNNKNLTLDMFEKETISCSSYYHLCE